MNINLIVDQRYSFVQALRIAYDKAKQEGTLDEQTDLSCQVAFENSDPAAIYHESDMIYTGPQPACGGTYFRAWNLRECYEQARINSRQCVAESLSKELFDAVDELKTELKDTEPELSSGDWSFCISEKGEFNAKGLSAALSDAQLKVLTDTLNASEKMRSLARDYVRMVLSLVDVTLDGQDARYARYLSRPEHDKGESPE